MVAEWLKMGIRKFLFIKLEEEGTMAIKRAISSINMYHVVSRGTGRQLIFEEDEDYEFFLSLLDRDRTRFHVEVYAYCLMGNHVHLLLHAPLERVSAFMKHLNGTYAQWFNGKAGRTGHLFQERFWSEAVNDEEYLLTVIHYIHHNPTRAMLGDASTYPWSSYREYLGEPRLCATMFVLDLVGGREGFESLHGDEMLTQCLDVDTPRRRSKRLSDEEALAYAETVLDGVSVDEVKSLPKERRDDAIRSLRAAGLTVRRIERLTGIGACSIARVK